MFNYNVNLSISDWLTGSIKSFGSENKDYTSIRCDVMNENSNINASLNDHQKGQ